MSERAEVQERRDPSEHDPRGVFVAARAAARHLPQGGKILVVGSNTAERAMAPGSSIYGMTKAAVARLVRGLAWDFAARGIAVINVAPGPTQTDMNTDSLSGLLSLVCASWLVSRPRDSRHKSRGAAPGSQGAKSELIGHK